MTSSAPDALPRPVPGPAWLQTLALVLAGAIILMLPALIHGRPFHFVDFNQYYLIGEAILEKLLGGAAAPDGPPAVPADAPAPGQSPAPGNAGGDGYFSLIGAGRSPLYSVFGYVLASGLSMWLICLVQALLGAWLIVRALGLLGGLRRPGPVLASLAGLAVLSPLGFHVNLLMPDVFAGYMVIAILLLAFAPRLSLPETVFLAALVSASAFLHKSMLVLALAALALMVLARFWQWSRPYFARLAPAWLLGALALSMTVQALYGFAAERLTGDPLRSPPYLMARIYDDGPGQRHLEQACRADPEAYALCAFSGFEYTTHNDLIWGSNLSAGTPSFISSPPDLRQAMLDEQGRFVLKSVTAYPLSQLLATTGNTIRQFFLVSIDEINYGAVLILQQYTADDPQALAHTPGFAHCLAEPDSCTEENAYNRAWNSLVTATALASLALLLCLLGVWTLFRITPSGASMASQDRHLCLAWALLLILLANAFICGATSGVHARYQARLVWLVPLCLIVLQDPVRVLADRLQARYRRFA